MAPASSLTTGRASVRAVPLSVVLTGDEPPSEFRIFTAGEVDTVKGRFVFDDQAAASVLAEYQAHGIDLMVDYDHASLGSEHSPDPAQAGKAAGWFGLEVRNGELWAVNVRWTPAAAEALRAKEWRFMSPAFATDDEGRVTSLLNVAITNLPATRKLEPLMAASRTKTNAEALSAGGKMLDQDMSQKALEVIASGDAEAALAMLKDLIAAAAGGGAPAEAAPVEVEEMGGDKPKPEELAAPEDEGKDAVMAASSRLMRLTAKTTFAAAVDEVETWRTSHLKLEAETKKLAAERAALELGQRKENAAKLVALGAETPHTSGLASGKLAQRLVDEPLAEQNARVAALLAARGGKLPAAPKAPVTATATSTAAGVGDREVVTRFGAVTLSAREIRICEEQGTKLEAYAENKAIHLQARGGK